MMYVESSKQKQEKDGYIRASILLSKIERKYHKRLTNGLKCRFTWHYYADQVNRCTEDLVLLFLFSQKLQVV